MDAPTELLPCPFCGGEATLSTYETESLWSHNQVTYTQVGCGECNYSFATEPGFEMEAPERWNTRIAGQAELVENVRLAINAAFTELHSKPQARQMPLASSAYVTAQAAVLQALNTALQPLSQAGEERS